MARLSGVMPLGVTAHFASSSGATFGAFQEFHVLRRPSTGELRVATPGVCNNERRLVSEDEDRLTVDVLRLRPCSVVVTVASSENSMASSSAP
jgi:hypothetical protein